MRLAKTLSPSSPPSPLRPDALAPVTRLAEESSQRVAELKRVTATLGERSEQLDREIGRFTV